MHRLSKNSGLSQQIDRKLTEATKLRAQAKAEYRELRKLRARRTRLLTRLNGIDEERFQQMNILYADIQNRREAKAKHAKANPLKNLIVYKEAQIVPRRKVQVVLPDAAGPLAAPPVLPDDPMEAAADDPSMQDDAGASPPNTDEAEQK